MRTVRNAGGWLPLPPVGGSGRSERGRVARLAIECALGRAPATGAPRWLEQRIPRLAEWRVALPLDAWVGSADPLIADLRRRRAAVLAVRDRVASTIDGEEWCVLKGPALESLYAPARHRQFVDLDLLVRDASGAALAEEALASLGFQMQATATIGLHQGQLLRVETWRGVLTRGDDRWRLRADVYVGAIPTSRASWLCPPSSFWSSLARTRGSSFPIPAPWWSREVLLCECFERAALRPRDLVDLAVLMSAIGDGQPAPLTFARRAMLSALLATLDTVEGRSPRALSPLAALLRRRPQWGQFFEALAVAPSRAAWHVLVRTAQAARGERLAAYLAHHYAPDRGLEVLERKGTALLIRTADTSPTTWPTVTVRGERYVVMPSEFATPEVGQHLSVEVA